MKRPASIVPFALALLGTGPVCGQEDMEGLFPEAFATITEEDLLGHVIELASPHMEGRDSPSLGLDRAAEYIAGELREAGFQGVEDPDQFLISFSLKRPIPDPGACSLELEVGGEEAPESPGWMLDRDFTPLVACSGEAEGEPVFLGFGITGARGYDDLRAGKVYGKIAVVLEGEPRHKRILKGPEVTEAASAYAKIRSLEDVGAAGVLLVRRPPEEMPVGADGEPLEPLPVGFRHSWAFWNPASAVPVDPRPAPAGIPVLEISLEVASAILGCDVAAVAAEIDAKGKPQRFEREGVTVRMRAGTTTGDVPVSNVVGILKGTDPELAKEHVVIGAHYDHIGVDYWGRVGCGADDNASGTAAILEVAQAFQVAPPRRSIVVAAFAAEEDGLIGSAAFTEDRVLPHESMVAMLNMDMIGIGKANEVVVLGVDANPDLGKVLKRAKKLADTKIRKVITNKAGHLWSRSDQANFHEVGVPSLFFFEGPSEMDNEHYHVFTDTIDVLDLDKMTRTTRFVFNTAWLIANDDERPSPPE